MYFCLFDYLEVVVPHVSCIDLSRIVEKREKESLETLVTVNTVQPAIITCF